MTTVTVKGSWLAACGKGSEDKQFEVIEIVPTLAAHGSGFECMYRVKDNGHIWTVALCRCVGQ